MLLLGGGLLRFVQRTDRYRLPAAIVVSLLFCGLPFTASAWLAALAGAQPVGLSLAALLVLAVLVAGWLRQALQPAKQDLPPEPWMRSVHWIGLAIPPAVWLLFGFGLLPYFGQPLAFSWWPPALVIGGAALLFLAADRLPGLQNTPFSRLIERAASINWRPSTGRVFSQAVSSPLALLASLLEGRAGILWAMLFMALLLSVVGQFAVGG